MESGGGTGRRAGSGAWCRRGVCSWVVRTIELMEFVDACSVDGRGVVVCDEAKPPRLASVWVAHDDAIDHLTVEA